MKRLIRLADFYGVEVEFITNDGTKKYKNVFGGLLAILSLICIAAGFIYFGLKFFNRSDSIIISNLTNTGDVSIPNITQFPFFVRLSLSGAKLIPQPEKIWRAIFNLATYDPAISSSYTREYFDLERCDLNKHFTPYYQKYLEGFIDLNTYFCINWNNRKQFDLRGDYGSANYNQVFNFRFRACSPALGDVNCGTQTEINSYLTDAFIEIRTIDSQMDSNQLNVQQEYLWGDRIGVSNTIFRRINFLYKTVSYQTDLGYIFEANSNIIFNQFDNYKVDTDLKFFLNPSDNLNYNVFCIMNVGLSKLVIKYERTYMKAQTALANIGGIIKIITTCGTVISYLISYRLFNLDLANSVLIKPNESKKSHMEVFTTSSSEALNKRTSTTHNINSINPALVKAGRNQNYVNSFHEDVLQHFCKSKEKIKFTWYEKLIPAFCIRNKMKAQLFNEKLKYAKSFMNIFSFIKSQQEFQLLKECLLSKDQYGIISAFMADDNQEVQYYRSNIMSRDHKALADLVLLNLTN